VANINVRKRSQHRRRVQAALSEILNDPSVMPNVDCPNLVIVVTQVEFGRTVRDILVRCCALPKQAIIPGQEPHVVRYQREAELRTGGVYDDFYDLRYFGRLSALAGAELQKRLGLLYVPEIRWLPAALTANDGEPTMETVFDEPDA